MQNLCDTKYLSKENHDVDEFGLFIPKLPFSLAVGLAYLVIGCLQRKLSIYFSHSIKPSSTWLTITFAPLANDSRSLRSNEKVTLSKNAFETWLRWCSDPKLFRCKGVKSSYNFEDISCCG